MIDPRVDQAVWLGIESADTFGIGPRVFICGNPNLAMVLIDGTALGWYSR